MIATVLKGALAAMVALAAIAIAIAAYAYINVGEVIFNRTNSGLKYAAELAAVPIEVAQLLALLMTLLLTGPAVSFLVKLALGRISPLAIGAVAVVTAAAIGTWIFATRAWLFGVHGEPLAFACPPLVIGANFRVQRDPFDHQLGGACPKIDATIAAKVIAQRNAGPAELVVPVTEAEARNLARFDQEGPVLLAGAPEVPGGPPRLYRGHAAHDPLTGAWLMPASNEDIDRVVAVIVAKRQAEEKAARLAAEAKAAQEADRINVAKVRQLRQINDSNYADVDDVDWSTTEDSGEEGEDDPEWQSYFDAIDDRAPLVVVLGHVDARVRAALSSAVSYGSYWGEKVVRDLDRVRHVASQAAERLPIRHEIFPPTLRYFTVVRVNYKMTANKYCVTVVKYDLKKWTYESRAQAVSV